MDTKFIHLLYVPTMACNMACKYCYLEDNTRDQMHEHGPLETLSFAIKKLGDAGVVPFNISLHGGEVTTLSSSNFESLVKFISEYYTKNGKLISDNGFKVGTPHIKTNLYNIERHLDAIKQYNVSISGSLDLPFSLHDEFRITKGNVKTLNKILDNVRLLENLPNKKKVSATIFKEHFNRIDEIISDIKFLNSETCLDMNDFNFMIGFDYNSNGMLHHLTEDEQVEFFRRMHQEFDGSDLDKGVNGAWFNEFGPEYCTNCDNCGQKFFLLEKNGDIYSCVRGQKHKDFFYGNIYDDSVADILKNAQQKMMMNHNRVGFNPECADCKYLYICKTGCPFVKNNYKSNKSYTCQLQQELYRKREYRESPNPRIDAYNYILKMHPNLALDYIPKSYEENSLPDLISKDPRLKYIYDSDSFALRINDEIHQLESQLTKNYRKIVDITPDDEVRLYIKQHILDEQSDYPNNNALYIQLLSGDCHTYGDEQRYKQMHIATLQVYKFVLEQNQEDDYFVFDLKPLLREYGKYLSKEKPNNIFFTTSHLRDYHYQKQKNNAYYHIAAINLPFQNIEFNYLEEPQHD